MNDVEKNGIRLHIAAVVEGYGEVSAFPILLERIWYELLGGEYIEILRPMIRQPRDRLATNKGLALEKAVERASAKLAATPNPNCAAELIVVMIDADDDLPCELAPRLLRIAKAAREDKNISCVIANVAYETWFAASVESLSEFLELRAGEDFPIDPEGNRYGKGWIKQRFRGAKYSETIDQAKMTAKIDLELCRSRSYSFDKLCREIEQSAF